MGLMNADQAAEYLGVNIRKLRRLTNSRAIAVVRLSPRVPRYKQSDLDRFINQRRIEAVK